MLRAPIPRLAPVISTVFPAISVMCVLPQARPDHHFPVGPARRHLTPPGRGWNLFPTSVYPRKGFSMTAQLRLAALSAAATLAAGAASADLTAAQVWADW